MSAKHVLIFLGVACVAGGWYFYANYKTEWKKAENGSLEYIKITPRGDKGNPSEKNPKELPGVDLPPVTKKDSIRIATFNLGRLDEARMNSPVVRDVLVRVIAQFDIVAVQNIHSGNRGVLVKLVNRINKSGKSYDYAVCSRVLTEPVDQFSAFLFDKSTIEIDRDTVETIEDRSNQFINRPLVGAFRVRGPDTSEAFTFTLVNVHNEPQNAKTELNLLDDVYRAVRTDGRNEDDVILLGDFGAEVGDLGELGESKEMAVCITHTPTTTRGTSVVDNILFDRRATVEFTGMVGVVDLIRVCELSMQEALDVSDHLPVWAEFSSYEGGQPGYVAGRFDRTTR